MGAAPGTWQVLLVQLPAGPDTLFVGRVPHMTLSHSEAVPAKAAGGHAAPVTLSGCSWLHPEPMCTLTPGQGMLWSPLDCCCVCR